MLKRKIQNKKKFIIFLILLVVFLSGIIFGAKKIWNWYENKNAIERAGKNGEVVEYQALVQIQKINGTAEVVANAMQKGDVVVIAEANKEWSRAELEGFLIVKIKLTEAQAGLLISQEKADQNATSQKPRKYAVDFSKMGIDPNDESGRKIEDKIFDWKIIVEKGK